MLIGNEEDPYKKSLELGKDYFVVTKEENPNEWDTMITAINEDYFENTGRNSIKVVVQKQFIYLRKQGVI